MTETTLERPIERIRPSVPPPDADVPALTISVILTVRNDPDGLAEALASLAQQTRPADEIVVCDGGSDEARLAATRRLVGRYATARLLVGKRCNIAEGRNRAIRDARGGIIACIDAGCRAHPTWLERLTAPLLTSNAEVVGGGYRVTPRSELQRMASLLTMRRTTDADPLRFNPSARSLAFRRDAWERAGGFPSWLQTAEDTLFCLKLRTMTPAPAYTFAPEAVATWTPRPTLRQTLTQFYRYARGEGQIDRGGATQRYHVMRWAAALTWAVAGVMLSGHGATAAATACAIIAAWAFVRPFSLRAGDIADRMGVAAVPFAFLMNEMLTIVQWFGWLRGARDRRQSGDVYIERLERYFGRDSADGKIAPWNTTTRVAPPTLVVAWNWAPAARASAQVMETLFKQAPRGVFRVLTRRYPGKPPMLPWEDAVPTERLRWPLTSDEPVRLWTWLAELTTTCKALSRACAMNRARRIERVLAIYPTRYGLLSGWMISKVIGAPLVLYMHDLCAEALLTGSRLKRWFWTAIDRRIVSDATLVIVPTDEMAEHYRGRGVAQIVVLPHCIPDDVCESARERASSTGDALHSANEHGGDAGTESLRLVYAGRVYDAHADAAAALATAVQDQPDLSMAFLSNAHPALSGCDVRWMERAAALREVAAADACVVVLSFTQWPEEVRCCFPSKLTEYLALGKPILAVVPAGCFTDRFLRTHACGLVVNSLDAGAIREALDSLRDPARREELAAHAKAAARTLNALPWMNALLEALRTGTTTTPSIDGPPTCSSGGNTAAPRATTVGATAGVTADRTRAATDLKPSPAADPATCVEAPAGST